MHRQRLTVLGAILNTYAGNLKIMHRAYYLSDTWSSGKTAIEEVTKDISRQCIIFQLKPFQGFQDVLVRITKRPPSIIVSLFFFPFCLTETTATLVVSLNILLKWSARPESSWQTYFARTKIVRQQTPADNQIINTLSYKRVGYRMFDYTLTIIQPKSYLTHS